MPTNINSDRNGNVIHQFNYVTTNRFYVEIGGIINASFTECSGLSVQIKKDVYYEGGVNHQQRVCLGHPEFADVTLKRGITDEPMFWKWLSEIWDSKEEHKQSIRRNVNSKEENKQSIRRNVNILVFNQAGKIMRSWTLIGAIPISWKSSALQADGNAVAIEELTLAFEGLNVGKTAGGCKIKPRDDLGFFSSQ